MRKKLLSHVGWLFIFIPSMLLVNGCSSSSLEASIPAYVSVPALELQTDYPTEGTAHSKFTTAWIFFNDDPVGAFELPCTVPVITNGDVGELQIFPGISANGISATRSIYAPCEPIVLNVGLTELDTFYVNENTDSIPKTRYYDNSTVTVVEDFDGSGINLEPSFGSDTSIIIVSDETETFDFPGEDNENCGLLTLTSEDAVAEVKTSDTYSLPKGRDVYLEVTYKSNNSLLVGLIANEGTPVNRPIILLRSTEDEWNKIYIDLSTEITASSNGITFNVFFGMLKDEGVDVAKVYLDNLKLVYR